MKSDSSVWKNRKTLILMKDAPTAQTAIWSRWDIAIATVDPGLLAWNPQVVVLIEATPEVMLWLKKPDAKDTRFILISRKVVEAFGEDAFQNLGLGNVLCLDEFADMYPFIGHIWDGTVEDALVCASIVFRYQRLVGVTVEKGQARLAEVTLKPVNLEILLETKAPEPLVLIQQYYKPPQAARIRELEKCLKKNLENPLIDRIYLFVESKDLKLPKSDKLVLMYKKTRITYADCIELIQTKIGKGHLVAFANADIYLDASWSNLWATNIKDVCLALLRWEEEGNDGTSITPELYGPRADSQDTWVLHSDSVIERTWNMEPFKIPFGTAGCDNAILVEFLRQKFRIVNPAMSLRTIHVHKSQIRSYDPKDIVDRPTYMFVDPTGIHELNPLTQWTGWASKLVSQEALDRHL